MNQVLKVVFLMIFILSSCKSSEGKDLNVGKKLDNKINVLHMDINCQNQEELNLQIDNNSYVLIQPNLCDVFADYISQGKIVNLDLTGKFNDSIFDIHDGNYRVFEYDSLDKSLNKIKSVGLSFGNFGFIVDDSEFKKSIPYKIAKSNFKLVKNENKSLSNERYKLIFNLNSRSN